MYYIFFKLFLKELCTINNQLEIANIAIEYHAQITYALNCINFTSYIYAIA